MDIGAISRRWIDVIAAMLFAWHDAQRAKRSLVVAQEKEAFVVRQAGRGGSSVVATFAAGAPPPIEVTRAARNGLVVLELPGDEIVVRRISVPVQAREFLPGIIRNQIERLSPWQVDQALYGFAAEVSSEDTASLDVRVLITSREAVDAARDRLAAIGLPVDDMVAGATDMPASAPITLWSRVGRADRDGHARRQRIVGASIAAFVGASLALSAWAFASAASIREAGDDAAARAMKLQQQIRQSGSPQAMAALAPAERAWVAKGTSRSVVITLEALSRALPDAAYLTELHLDSATLRMIGVAGDVPSLIAPLEKSGYLTNVHFFAPTTRGPDGRLFRFNIEARVEPRREIAGD
jgi:general secretion pathway protein L